MIRITAYLRPHRLEMVKTAVAAIGVSGLTVADVRGTGNSSESASLFGGVSRAGAMPIRSRLTVVVADDLAEAVVTAMIENARTGEPNDGKIFLERIVDAVRVRTGERGDAAI